MAHAASPTYGTAAPAAGADRGIPPQLLVAGLAAGGQNVPLAAAGLAAGGKNVPLYMVLGDMAKALPQQVGHPTPTSLAHQKTFLCILVFQGIMGVAGLVRLFDFLTFVATVIMLILGHQAYKHYMHITYVSAWGILCTAVGICQVIGEIFPILFGVFSLKLMEAAIRVTIPVSSLLGAAFAWHLYVDYCNQTQTADFGIHTAVRDPLSNVFGHADYTKMNIYGEVDGAAPATKTNPPNHV